MPIEQAGASGSLSFLDLQFSALSFDAVFMPHMLTNDGRPLIERIQEAKLLPPPNNT